MVSDVLSQFKTLLYFILFSVQGTSSSHTCVLWRLSENLVFGVYETEDVSAYTIRILVSKSTLLGLSIRIAVSKENSWSLWVVSVRTAAVHSDPRASYVLFFL